MSLLSIVQQASSRIGLAEPSIVVGSTDKKAKHFLSLVNEEGKKLSTGSSVGASFNWQVMIRETSFSAQAQEDQGRIEEIAPGFKYIINNTIFNRTLRRPVPGPLPPNAWQLLKAANVVGPYPQYRIRNGNLLLLPAPVSGNTIYFEYESIYWATSSGGTPQAAMTADSDVSLLDEELITQGVVWRWKRSKNLEYAEEFRDYQTSVLVAMARDGGKPTINIGNPEFSPGTLYVPQSPGIVPIP